MAREQIKEGRSYEAIAWRTKYVRGHTRMHI